MLKDIGKSKHLIPSDTNMNLPSKLFDINMHVPHLTKNLHRDDRKHEIGGGGQSIVWLKAARVLREPQQAWI